MFDHILGKLPFVTLFPVIFPAGFRDPVVGPAFSVVRETRIGFDIVVLLHAGKGGIQGGFLDNVGICGYRAALSGDFVAV